MTPTFLAGQALFLDPAKISASPSISSVDGLPPTFGGHYFIALHHDLVCGRVALVPTTSSDLLSDRTDLILAIPAEARRGPWYWTGRSCYALFGQCWSVRDTDLLAAREDDRALRDGVATSLTRGILSRLQARVRELHGDWACDCGMAA